jgi:hypothetical protein
VATAKYSKTRFLLQENKLSKKWLRKYSFEEFVSDPKPVPSSEDILQGFTQENT